MKFLLYFLLISVVILSSCNKDDDQPRVRYEFTSDVSDQYKIEYTKDQEGTSAFENYIGTSWSKSLRIERNEGWANPTIIALRVYPPSSWVGTTKSGNVTLKIIVNDEERVSITQTLKGTDFNNGIGDFTSL